MIKSRKKTATEQEFLINKLTNLKMIKTNLFRLKKVKKKRFVSLSNFKIL